MSREDRKLDHIQLALASIPNANSDFDDLHLPHRSLPETAYQDCWLDTQIGGLKLSSPIFINAMTGGSPKTTEINRGLAEAARETGVAMAVGSQRAALLNSSLRETFEIVRTVNPNGVISANLGAGATAEEAEKAVEMVQANFLQLHLNAPQELVMPEGDRDFSSILHAIEQVTNRLSVPVIVKEVGFGMTVDTYKKLQDVGVTAVDIGGRGGTNFLQIENARRKQQDYSYLQNWGQSTAISLLELQKLAYSFDVIASGGIRNPLDIVKSMILGAKAVGIAGALLKIFTKQGTSGVVQAITEWHEQIKTIMTMLGIRQIAECTSVPIVATGKCKEWCEAREISYQSLANRDVRSLS